MSCPVCGFDPAGVAPSDAEAALRSFSRRFGELVRPDPDAEETRPASELARLRPVVLAEAAAAASEIAAAGDDLRRVLVSTDAEVRSAGAPGPAGPPADTALDDLTAAAGSVASLAERTPAEDWTRTGTRAGRAVTAIDLLREAVHAGAHHLRAAAAAAGRPS